MSEYTDLWLRWLLSQIRVPDGLGVELIHSNLRSQTLEANQTRPQRSQLMSDGQTTLEVASLVHPAHHWYH